MGAVATLKVLGPAGILPLPVVRFWSRLSYLPGVSMTSPVQPDINAVSHTEPVAESVASDSEGKAAIPAFKFPFKPAQFLAAKNASQPSYRNGAGDYHAKTPGVAPPGTRRSMGKR